MAFILPHAVTLPGQYRITIHYLGGKRMPYAFGWWDSNTRKITINKDEPKWVQIRTLGHELVHAANDYSHWLEQNVVSPMQIEAGETVLALEEDDE